MKNLLVLGVLSTALFQASAFACPHSQQQFICPQDQVVDASGLTGHVVGINASAYEASVAYDAGYSNAVLDIRTLALQQGCIGSICVGDRAADASGLAATVIGLNPYNYTAALKYDAGYSNAVVAMNSLALGLGCLDHDCVGDPVADSSGLQGRIIGINYSRRKIVMSYDAGYSNAVLPIESVALGLGCAKGNCVNDLGTDSSGLTGKIVAINPYNGNLAFKYDAGYSNAILNPSSFMSSEYCTTYGDSDRILPIYIEAHGDSIRITVYTSDNASGRFLFSIARQ